MDKSRKVLLAVLAHPDDETFGAGGTLALYARAGVEVHLICATRGEVGDVDPRLLRGFNSVAERREHELRCAAELLGLSGVHFLDYRDSGMPGSPDNQHPNALAAQPVEEVAQKIEAVMLTVRPQVVFTNDPIGGYRHPDHIAVHKATQKAFMKLLADSNESGYKPERLYYQTIPRGFLKFMVKVMPLFGRDPRKFGQNKDIDLVSIAEVDFPIHTVVNYRAVAEIREQAARCHESQGGASLTSSSWAAKARRWFAAKEQYMQAYPEAQAGQKRSSDLFAGL